METFATLGRVLSKSREKFLFFFQVLRANKNFEWMPEWKDAFQLLKIHMKTLPTGALAKPMTADNLFLYLTIILVTVRSVLVKEEVKTQSQSIF